MGSVSAAAFGVGVDIVSELVFSLFHLNVVEKWDTVCFVKMQLSLAFHKLFVACVATRH